MHIVVHGAGIFGLSVAWACLERGAQVTVVDPDGPGAGASGGVVGALAPHVPEAWNTKKALQFDSLDMAELFWTEVAEASGATPAMRGRAGCSPWPTKRGGAGAGAGARRGSSGKGRYRWEVRTAADFPTSSTARRASSSSTRSPHGSIQGARSRRWSRR
jgi:glycine oxidase